MSYKTAEYDGEASSYDESRFSNKLGQHLDYMHKKILGSFINSSGKLVLEAGVGTGRFATWLAKKGFEVIGIDLSREMLKKAKEKKTSLNVDLVLILADVHFLPFKEGLFDACICINVLDHFSGIDGFLRQVKYVVKSEGYFVFNFSNLKSPYFPIALIINSKKQAIFRSGKIQSNWFTLRDIGSVLSRNGFVVTAVKGCFIASPVPWGNYLVKLIRMINFSAEDSWLKFLAGSPFVKVRSIGPLKH
jgi:ubiquinone/menaquinone biosynthesis C-methylase UbiE